MVARKRLSIALCLAALLLLEGQSLAGQSESLLNQAMALFRVGKFSESLEMLRKAREEHTAEELDRGRKDPGLLGKIALYEGLSYAVIQKKAQAQKAFRTALGHDPTIRLSPHQFKPELVRLFNSVRGQMRCRLLVTSDLPRARVVVDDKDVGEAPIKLELPVGRYRVQVSSKDGLQSFSKEVMLTPERPTRVTAIMKKRAGDKPPPPPNPSPVNRSRPRVWTWVAAGGAAAFSIAGIALWASSEATYNALEQDYPSLLASGDLNRIQELKDGVRSKEIASAVMFGLAGACAVTSVTLFFLENRASERPQQKSTSPWSMRVRPQAGAVNGLVLDLSF
jgi:tetratricopeptide (TPR) repeat protein